MKAGDGFGFDPESTSRNQAHRPIGVHVLSEHVFCPRAALIASELGQDTGDEEPNLGPRLDLFVHYNEHKFAEALQQAWGEMRLWVALMAPSLFVVFLASYFHSLLAGFVVSLPLLILLAKCWDTLNHVIALVRERARFEAAAHVEIDMWPTEERSLDWWSLRKAGFDCTNLFDKLEAPEGDTIGRPWRILMKGNTTGIPVIRRRSGSSGKGPQHDIRVAAYCNLIEKCQNQSAPFGVILFSGTTDCLIIPNTPALQQKYRVALQKAQEFLEIHAGGKHSPPPAPTDNRCTGCPYGKPREFQRGKSESVFNGTPATPFTTNSVRASDGTIRGAFHCTCGDRFQGVHFQWVPPHRDAIKLGLAKPNSG